MKSIPLTQGKVAVVDHDKFSLTVPFKWHAQNIKGIWYARSRDANGKCISLHQLILPGCPKIDHKDGDGLNCRTENLRPVTDSQNQWNRRKAKGHSSRFKGVCWDKSRQRWIAHITIFWKQKYLGRFQTKVAAAKAYNAAAKIFFGEFAKLNPV